LRAKKSEPPLKPLTMVLDGLKKKHKIRSDKIEWEIEGSRNKKEK
jgi:hypothetical protein